MSKSDKPSLYKEKRHFFYNWQSAMPPSSRLLPPNPKPENFSLVPPDEDPKPPELELSPKLDEGFAKARVRCGRPPDGLVPTVDCWLWSGRDCWAGRDIDMLPVPDRGWSIKSVSVKYLDISVITIIVTLTDLCWDCSEPGQTFLSNRMSTFAPGPGRFCRKGLRVSGISGGRPQAGKLSPCRKLRPRNRRHLLQIN